MDNKNLQKFCLLLTYRLLRNKAEYTETTYLNPYINL